jgi:ubiquinone/menaquinone biosynthesis C-methylase UbiE
MLPFTGERYVPSIRGQIAYEHLHRYAIATRFARDKRVLDIASGEGYGAALLARGARSVLGVDADPAAVEHGRRAYYASNLRFVQGSCGDVPAADGSFDVAVSFETIEHVAEHDRMLDEMRRVLVPGGVLILSSPNKLVYSDAAGYANPYHVKELYFADLRDLLVRRFKHVRLFGQRIAALSLVHPLAGDTSAGPAWYSGSAERVEPGLPAVAAPHYFIAVASDAELDWDVSSAFIDPRDDLLEHVWSELNGLRASAQTLVAAPALTALGGTPPESAPLAAPAPEPPAARPEPPAPEPEPPAPEPDPTGPLRAQLEQAEERCRALADEAERLRAQAAGAAELEARLAEESLRARTLRATAENLSEEAARSRAEAQAATAELEHERARHAQTARELSALRETAAAAQARAEAHAAALAALSGESESLRAAADAAHAERAALQAELAAQAERAAGSESVLREVLASHSWKMTYPLRRAVSLVRR